MIKIAGEGSLPTPDETYVCRAVYYVSESEWDYADQVLYDTFTIRIKNNNECDDFAWVDAIGDPTYT